MVILFKGPVISVRLVRAPTLTLQQSTALTPPFSPTLHFPSLGCIVVAWKTIHGFLKVGTRAGYSRHPPMLDHL